MNTQTGLRTRLHKYITKHSEYLFEGDRCLAVLAAGSTAEQCGHGALRQRLVASVRWSRDGRHEVIPGQRPKIGDSLLIGENGSELLTSVVRQIVDVSQSSSG
jgi:hypothetical protein